MQEHNKGIFDESTGRYVPTLGRTSATADDMMDDPPKHSEAQEEHKMEMQDEDLPRRNPGSPIPPVQDPENAPPMGTHNNGVPLDLDL